MSKERLFTVGITVYNNESYLYEVLDSIFMQTYPNIEIVISDDGSKKFDKDKYEEYIAKHKGENVTNYIICQQQVNVGTVKNANFILSKAKGEYFMFIAADDTFYDKHVLQRFANEFEKKGENCRILSASVAMCTENVNEVLNVAPGYRAIEFIKKSSSEEMFVRLANEYTVPAGGSCYRRKLFEELNNYDEEYKLIEDGPFFIRMARLGYQFYWIDDMVATRHRDGGISHGNRNNGSKTYQKYVEDEMLFFEKEVIPYKERIPSDKFYISMQKYEYLKKQYYDMFIKQQKTFFERIRYLKKQGWLKTILKQSIKNTVRCLYNCLKLVYYNLPKLSIGLVVLFFLARELKIGIALQLGVMSMITVGSWLILKMLSILRYIFAICKRGGRI